MKSRWLAYLLVGPVCLGLACKGGGEGAGSFLEIVETAPENGEQAFIVEGRIAVRVDSAIDPSTLSSDTLFLTDQDGAVVPSTVSIVQEPDDADPSLIGTAAELTPDAPLAVITDFTVTLTTGLTSTNGRTLEEDFQWTFRTIDAQWGISELIEPEETVTPVTSSEQKLGTDAQLNAIAVWKLEDDTGSAIYANRYTRTDLWGSARPIDEGSGGVTNPALAVDDAGNGFAVWERSADGGATANIWTNRYDADDGTWGTPELLQNGDVTAAASPSIAANPAGNAIAVWRQRDEDTGRQVLRAIRYDPSTDWGTAETIGEPTATQTGPVTAIGMDDSGAAIAMWSTQTAGGRVLWANRYLPGPGWGTESLVKSDDMTSASGMRLAVAADGTAVAIWGQDNGDDLAPRDDVWAARFSGSAWSDPARVDAYDDGDKTGPDIAMDATGVAYAVWSQADPDFANIWSAQYIPGSGWSAPELIEPPNEDPNDDGDATFPRVAVNRVGNAFVVWRQVWDSWGSIWSNRLDPGGPWVAAERIEDIPGAANLPIVAVDEGRHAHALWLHPEAGTMKVRTNRFE